MRVKNYYSEPLRVTAAEIEGDQRFQMKVVAGEEGLWEELARDFCALVAANEAAGRATCAIVWPRWLRLHAVAARLNAGGIRCQRLLLFHPEEFCDERGECLPPSHPLSLRRRLWCDFYGRLDPGLRPAESKIVFPDARRPGEFGSRIVDAGGAEVCYAALGMDGHFGFQAGPAAGEPDDDHYFELPARVIALSPQALREAAVEFACGNTASIPKAAVSAGLAEVMRAASLRLFLAHRWQSPVLRRTLYGPVAANYPASIVQRHPELQVTMVPEVAQPPETAAPP
jgi:glucosamine-6-phosphate deaminase